jgi:hypothetical protein
LRDANGEDIEFNKLKSALIVAIQIGLDKLKSDNNQDRDSTMAIALNKAKVALEQFQD